MEIDKLQDKPDAARVGEILDGILDAALALKARLADSTRDIRA